MKLLPNMSAEQEEGYKKAVATVFRILEEEKRIDIKSPLYFAFDFVDCILAFRFDLTEKEKSAFKIT